MLRRSLIFVLIFIAAIAVAETTKRLIMKDGSYQSVTNYEVKGDRVRYLSAERYEWEDVPNDLIDWPATDKYNKSLETEVSHSAAEIDKEVEEEKKEEAERTPQVAPNLRLPDGGGVLVLDYYRDVPELIELQQATSELGSSDSKSRVLRATIDPFASQKQRIELPGQHAKVQLHIARPSIYINVDDTLAKSTSGDADKTNDALLMPPSRPQRYRLVRMSEKKDTRVVGNLKVSITGHTTQGQTFVPSQGEAMTGGWIKVTPTQDLAPGEYAVVEMLGAKEMNLYVWDLGVNPSAPENAAATKPEDDRPVASHSEQPPPALNKRPKP